MRAGSSWQGDDALREVRGRDRDGGCLVDGVQCRYATCTSCARWTVDRQGSVHPLVRKLPSRRAIMLFARARMPANLLCIPIRQRLRDLDVKSLLPLNQRQRRREIAISGRSRRRSASKKICRDSVCNLSQPIVSPLFCFHRFVSFLFCFC